MMFYSLLDLCAKLSINRFAFPPTSSSSTTAAAAVAAMAMGKREGETEKREKKSCTLDSM